MSGTSKTSRISLTLLCSMLCMWTSVECWSYFYSDNTMNWPNARAWCQEHYTDMVAIQNQGEIEHLNTWLPRKSTYYWIGIRKVNDVWTWVGTNKTLTEEATNWAKGEPNNGKSGKLTGLNEDCVEMYIKREYQAGKWNDERCGKLKTALCYTAACKNDSCLYGECVETINSHECACYEGFYGDRCDQVVKCNEEEVTVPYKGNVECTHKYGEFSYDSSCQYSCEEGYQLSMSRPLTCTGTKQWSEQPPTCELVQCQKLSSPAKGSMRCADPLGSSSYQSTCVFICDEGYELAGSQSDTLHCEASGFWNASQPVCAAVQCRAISGLENGVVSCGDDADVKFSYENTCSFSCARGYHLVGPSRVTCTSAAEWSDIMPRCEAITCQNPEGEAHLIPQCSQPLTKLQPDSTCSFSCDAGFELQGANTIQCSEEGQWSEAIPTCKAMGCPAPEIPTNAQISCGLSLSSPVSTTTPHPLGMVCIFSCDEGHELQGEIIMECANSGQWTSTAPNCTAMRCPLLEAPENGHMNCSNSEQFNSQCSFTCNDHYSLHGHELLTCDHHGNWTGEKPTCQAPPPKTAAIAAGAATGGALTFSALSAALWILKRLKNKASKFELSSNSDIDVPQPVYKNSIESLI
ncbi:E-selectin [Centropristis striata]|uniref:E-selectin n=1 Tax=Centropristis striata TaxID=184440 RepID=UPI0027DFE807|nr:E-selectin [Centropristis striata]